MRASQRRGRLDLSSFATFCFDFSRSPCFSSDFGFRVSFRFQDLKKCGHFEWIDEYVGRLQLEGLIDMGAQPRKLNLPSGVGKFGSDNVTPTAGGEALKMELKKLNKNLRQMIRLKKQANLMTAGFYFCIIALGFVYLLMNNH